MQENQQDNVRCEGCHAFDTTSAHSTLANAGFGHCLVEQRRAPDSGKWFSRSRFKSGAIGRACPDFKPKPTEDGEGLF